MKTLLEIRVVKSLIQCNIDILGRHKFARHMDTTHSGTWPCEKCGAMFKSRAYLQKHTLIMHQRDEDKPHRLALDEMVCDRSWQLGEGGRKKQQQNFNNYGSGDVPPSKARSWALVVFILIWDVPTYRHPARTVSSYIAAQWLEEFPKITLQGY